MQHQENFCEEPAVPLPFPILELSLMVSIFDLPWLLGSGKPNFKPRTAIVVVLTVPSSGLFPTFVMGSTVVRFVMSPPFFFWREV